MAKICLEAISKHIRDKKVIRCSQYERELVYYEMTVDLVLRYLLYFAKLTISVLICNHAVHSKLGLNHLCFQKMKS